MDETKKRKNNDLSQQTNLFHFLNFLFMFIKGRERREREIKIRSGKCPNNKNFTVTHIDQDDPRRRRSDEEPMATRTNGRTDELEYI